MAKAAKPAEGAASAKAAKPAEGANDAVKTKASKEGFTYPVYDLWKVDREDLKSDKSGDPKQVKFTAVKIAHL